MGIGLTAEHRALAESVRGQAARDAGHGAPAEQGVLGLHLPEELGGQGYGLLELCVALEELGERRVPGPCLPSVLAAAAAARSPGCRDLVAGLAGGSLTATVVLRGTGFGAAGADLSLVPVGEGAWALLDREDVTAEPVEGVDLDRELCAVTVVTVPDERVLGAAPVRELAAVLLGADACGAGGWAVRTATEYAGTREQFGRPIGQFQGVKHRLAAALVTLEQARAAVWDAARALDAAGDAGDLPDEARL